MGWAVNRFLRPPPVTPPPPVLKFRCDYYGVTSFEVEAENAQEAATLAEDMLRDEAWHGFEVRSLGPASQPEKPRIGPPEWHAALALAEHERPFDMIAIEVGTSQWWLTNGHVAIRASGAQPLAKSYPMVEYRRSDVRLVPERRTTKDERHAVRMGRNAWAQEHYLWLVEELFGECRWHHNDAARDMSILASREGGGVVAVVMRYMVDGDGEPFTPATEEASL